MRYLLVQFIRKPNGRIDEVVSVAKSLTPKNQEDNNVIVDFGNHTVIKSVIENKTHETTFEKIREYYNKVYPTLIEQLTKEAPISAAQTSKLSKLKATPNIKL